MKCPPKSPDLNLLDHLQYKLGKLIRVPILQLLIAKWIFRSFHSNLTDNNKYINSNLMPKRYQCNNYFSSFIKSFRKYIKCMLIRVKVYILNSQNRIFNNFMEYSPPYLDVYTTMLVVNIDRRVNKKVTNSV